MIPPLAPEWTAWLAENALRGASPADLIEALRSQGVDEDRAAREVDAVLRSPILTGARTLLERSAGVEQAARLRRTLDGGGIDERTALDDETLRLAYFSANRPVVLRGAAQGWTAARWTFDDLARRFGDLPVDVLVGRTTTPRWWATERATLTRTVPFRELLRTCTGAPGDDVYADGRTELLDRPGFAASRADLGLLPGLRGDGLPKAWLGPAGTVTPLHHDQSTGWLVQLVGRKRVWMASPLEPALMTTAVGVYNTADPLAPAGELAEVAWRELVLAPGDALLVPVGWWHRVEALDPSISVSFGGFRWPNVFDWYTPGRRVR